MKLDEHVKHQLIHCSTKVYQGYLALDFFKTQPLLISTSELPCSLFEFIRPRLQHLSIPTQETLVLGEKNYDLHLKKLSDYPNRVACTLSHPLNAMNPLQLPSDYLEKDIAALFCNRTFFIDTSTTGDMSVSLPLDANHTIGGMGKLELYRTHLVTLFNIIKKLHTETDTSNLLVALATGSGKTYVQALWMSVLHLGGFTGVFAVPDQLMVQFCKDLQRFLPDPVMQGVVILRDQDAQEAKDILHMPGKIIIASNHDLLDEHYLDVLNTPLPHTFLSFDEQHLVMLNERRRMQLLQLSKKFLCMFLTATPSRNTYDLSGAKPVAIMSSGQKEKAGQGQFPTLITSQCEFISDLHRQQSAVVHPQKKWLNGLFLQVNSAFQAECSSAAKAVLQDLPYMLHRKTGESDLRWALQVPIARKMLCVIDDNESLINFCDFLQTNHRNVYHNGNFIERHSISALFGMNDVDAFTQAAEKRKKDSKYLEHLSPEELAVLGPMHAETTNQGLKRQLQSNIFHYLVEYVLSDLTGMDLIGHNRLRKQSLSDFVELVKSKYRARSKAYYVEKLAKDIDPQGAECFGELLEHISNYFGRLSHTFPEDLRLFSDNWFLDRTLFRKIGALRPSFFRQFDDYTEKYLVMGVMSGMESAEMPITESQPFFGLKETKYVIYDSDKPKKRQRTSVELLNDAAKESVFEPRYDPISERIADNYFRLGFVGAYVSNKKTEGFSDPNLHTVINIAEHAYSPNNNPTTLIQSMGRNRGLDDTVTPQYIHALGRNQCSSFDLASLKKDDYYPDLFAAQESYKKNYIAALGEQVGKDIVAWYHQHVDIDDTIDADQLKRQVLTYVTRALRRLNEQEEHQIHISRAQLTQVIAAVMSTLDKEIAYLKRPYQLSFLIRSLGSLINFVCEVYYSWMRIKPAVAFYRHAWSLPKPEQASAENKADIAYMKIIRHTRFKHLVSQSLVMAEFKTGMLRQQAAIKRTLQKSLYRYATPAVQTQMDAYLQHTIIPLLEKMVVRDKVELVREKLTAVSDLFSVLHSHQALINSLHTGSEQAAFVEKALGLFHAIPGLETVRVDDIVHFPQLLKEDAAWMRQDPLELLHLEPELQASAAVELTQFLQNDFLTHLSAFVTYPEKTQIEAALLDTSKVQGFVQSILHKTQEMKKMPDFDVIFEEFKQHFSLPWIDDLPNKIKKMMGDFQQLQQEFAKEHIAEHITPLIHHELLPCLVNYYPQSDRQRLLDGIQSEKLTQLLHDKQEDIQTLTTDPTDLADFLFSNLCSNVPQQCNLDLELKKSNDYIASQTTGVGLFANLVMVGLGLGQTRIEYILVSEGFFNAISLMLPFHQWIELKKIFRDSSNSQTLRTLASMIDTRLQNKQVLNVEWLLQTINSVFGTQYQDTLAFGNQIAKKLKNKIKPAAFKFNPSQEKRLACLIREKCLPLIAAFIKDDRKKHSFLAVAGAKSSQAIGAFFKSYHKQLQNLSTANEINAREIASQLMSKLCPGLIKSQDMIYPMQHASESQALCQKVLQNRMKAMFLMSTTWKQKMARFFNTEDYHVLDAHFTDRINAENFAQQVHLEAEQVDETVLLDTLRSSDDLDLQAIRSLPERMADLQRDMKAWSEDQHSLDKEKLADLMVQQLSSILGHSEFQSSLNAFIGLLSQQDIQLIFEAKGIATPLDSSVRLARFQHIIQQKDWNAFKQEFVGQSNDLDHLPLEKVLSDFSHLIEEVMDCHGYYNQHTAKGMQRTNIAPALLTKMSPQLKDIRVPAFARSFMSHFSRRIFFIQGIRNGLPRASQVSADLNQTTISTLERIKNNILQPLWWRVNASKVLSYVIATGKHIINFVRDAGFWIWNTLTSLLGYGQRSSEHPDSIDYRETALDCARVINELTPLTSERISQQDCPTDAIRQVEQYIDQRPIKSSMRLFDHSTGPIASESASHSSVLNPSA
ncbi:MAG: hypothetical protein CK424_06885 [Legionella sp.]|nr:MAG: hypothetical protein CK424_06885 [Legionella sp.]